MITVLGSSGFIGSNILASLKKKNIECYAPERNDRLNEKELGDVIFCIGMTSDFRNKPFETVEAHVCKLNYILSNCVFDSLTYLSSTRVYINSNEREVFEEDKILVDPLNYEDLYTLTKLTGERLCLSSQKKVRIARLSNVIGKFHDSSNFLFDIMEDIKSKGSVHLRQSIMSEKDYINVDDVADLLVKITLHGKQLIYNVASGFNTTNKEILDKLKEHTSFDYTVEENAKKIAFPKISNEKICNEFGYVPAKIIDQINNYL